MRTTSSSDGQRHGGSWAAEDEVLVASAKHSDRLQPSVVRSRSVRLRVALEWTGPRFCGIRCGGNEASLAALAASKNGGATAPGMWSWRKRTPRSPG